MAEKKKFSIAALFIKEDEAPRTPSTKTEEVPAEATETQAVSGQVSEEVASTLKGILAENKLDGFEYLQFRETLNNIDIEDESVKFKSAMAAVTAMKGNPEVLLTSAKSYIMVLKDQSKEYSKLMAGKLADVAEKEGEAASMQAQIEKLQASKASLEAGAAKTRKNIAAKQATFDATCASLVDEIAADIEKIKKFKKV